MTAESNTDSKEDDNHVAKRPKNTQKYTTDSNSCGIATIQAKLPVVPKCGKGI
jgi:hypothetical protein